MGKGRHFLERIAEETDIMVEPLPGQPIIEIAGDRRVLIENHFGVKGYSPERIVVKVKYGFLCICGCGMEIVKMTREQLVIHGKLNEITLQRRG